MAYQSKTYSLSDEVVAVIEAAKAGGTSPNKLLRRVLGIDEDGEGKVSQAGSARHHTDYCAMPLDHEGQCAAVVTRIAVPQSNYRERGLLPCRHCGEYGKIHPRAGAWRACTSCQSSGHLNISDCRRCREIERTKKKAASPTGVEDESVDYDWKDPA
jgi:hypothetical protein